MAAWRVQQQVCYLGKARAPIVVDSLNSSHKSDGWPNGMLLSGHKREYLVSPERAQHRTTETTEQCQVAALVLCELMNFYKIRCKVDKD